MNEDAAMQELWTETHCAAADRRCRGRLEWHHAIKQQRLKREFRFGAWRHVGASECWRPVGRHGIRSVYQVEQLPLDAILGDPRNRVWLCSHHHELVTNGRLEIQLPDSVWEFAREFGLAAQLENDLARRTAA